jgi:hypothetical protein
VQNEQLQARAGMRCASGRVKVNPTLPQRQRPLILHVL